MEIAPGIHNILTDLQHATGVTNTYLVVGSDGAAFVDTGWDRPGEAQARIEYWERIGRPILEGIVVTHRHPPHWGNAPAIQKACGNPPIISTLLEKGEIEKRMQGACVERAVQDGDTLSLGNLTLEFVEAPGHTSAALRCSCARRERSSPATTSWERAARWSIPARARSCNICRLWRSSCATSRRRSIPGRAR